MRCGRWFDADELLCKEAAIRSLAAIAEARPEWKALVLKGGACSRVRERETRSCYLAIGYPTAACSFTFRCSWL